MRQAVYIRPLILEDAKVSCLWRNDAEIWKYTEFKPDRHISLEMEEEWLKSKLDNSNEKRFAICLEANDQYIGNIQLVGITQEEACYHIFIGEKSFWGQGISQMATKLILSYAFSELDLESVLLEVNPLNTVAYSIYEKTGFIPFGVNEKNGFIKMKLNKNKFEVIGIDLSVTNLSIK
jgi:diamine N-acetyltransferase